MAKNSLESIRKFIDHKEFAFIGMSRDEKKFSRSVFKELSKKGFKMYPVNPQMSDLDGEKCYHSISELPFGLTHALIMTPKEVTASAIEEAVAHGMTNIWIQQGAETPEAIETAKRLGVNYIQKACIMMYSEPVGSVHKFHRFIEKIFGKYPK